MRQEQRTFRFAPSPNGELHLGHAYSALLNLRQARESGGKCLLRIEDIDTTRCTPELERKMLEDLEWIGFEWDEEPRRQSEHFDEYRITLEQLLQQGLAYPSVMTRGEIRGFVQQYEKTGKHWPRDPDGSPVYPGREREFDLQKRTGIMRSGIAYSIRLDIDKAIKAIHSPLHWMEHGKGEQVQVTADPAIWGDIVLARKDAPASYHLCCVLDDALQGITDVTRGLDLYHATSIHVLLQKLLGISPPQYFHHKLVLGADGRKLSKSEQAKSIRNLREAGISREEISQKLFAD